MTFRQIFILLLALCLSALVWWVGPLASVGVYRPLTDPWIRMVIIALLMTWALWPLLRRPSIFRHRNVRHVAEPKSVDRVSSRLLDATRTLRHVGLASQRNFWQRSRYRLARGHLHDRPWFLVLGPPDVGKSALLQASGLRFLLSEHYGLPMTVDTGPTQDCNIWLAEEAVFVDAAGACIAHEGMDANTLSAWSILLRRVRRMRRTPAFDGIVLCLDAAWLVQASLASRKSLADALRGRLLEVAAWIRHDIPVHILVNRLDTLPGGATLLAALPDTPFADGVGMTLAPLDNAVPGGQLDAGYRELENRLQRQAITAMCVSHEGGNPRTRGEMLQGLEQIGEMRQPLLDLTEQIFPPSPVGFCARLRSVWLGSAAVADPEDGEGHGSRPLGHVYQRPLQRASRDRGWNAPGGKGHWRTRTARLGAYAMTLAMLAIAVVILGGRYLWEREYIGSAWAGFNEARLAAQASVAEPNGRAAVVQAADELRYMALLLDEAYGTGASPAFNPYAEHGLVKDAVSRTYRRHLAKGFWPELQHYVAAALAEETATQSADLFDTLKVYRMLVRPERRDADALVAWFDGRWDRLEPPGSTVVDRSAFNYHLRALFDTAGEALPAMKPDVELLRAARARAADLPLPTRVLSRLRTLPLPGTVEGVSLTVAAGSEASLALRRGGDATASDVAIPGIFTRAGYTDVFLPNIDAAATAVLEEGAWVLDNDAERAGNYTTVQRLADDTHRLYLQHYADAWEDFLKDIRIRQVASLDDASQLANQLAAPSSALGNLIRYAAQQTTLAGTAEGTLARATQSLERKKSALIGQLAGERKQGLSAVQQIVDARFDMLRRLAQRGGGERTEDNPLTRVFTELADQIATLVGALRAGQIMPNNDVLERLRADANRQPEPVRGIVNELIRIAGTQSLQSSRSTLASQASGAGSGICTRTVAGRYPFNRQAREEIGLNDFVNVFGRTGALQAFFDNNLAMHVDANANPWRARLSVVDGQPLVAPAAVHAFENAARIRDAFFADAGKFGFSMIVRPIELDPAVLEATLDIDGQVVQYAHGPQQPVRIDWPGPRGGVYARLSLRLIGDRIETISFDGPWALFRLFDAGTVRGMAADRRELALRAGAGAFRVEIRSSTQDFPLWSQALSRFRCPG